MFCHISTDVADLTHFNFFFGVEGGVGVTLIIRSNCENKIDEVAESGALQYLLGLTAGTF